MSTDLTQLLRLEIEREPDAGELVNRVANPDGKLGAWGWETPVAGSTLRSSPTYGLVYTSPGSVASYFRTEPMEVTAGQYVAASWLASTVFGKYAAQIEWLGAAGNVLSATSSTGNLSASADVVPYGAYVAPASTVYCRLRFDHYAAGGGNPTALSWLSVRDVSLTAANTSGELGSNRVNLVPNPSAETGTTSWLCEGGSIASSSTYAYVGTKSFRLTKTGSTGALVGITTITGVTGGRDYAAQMRVRPGTTVRGARLRARWLAAGGGEISTMTFDGLTETGAAWSDVLGGVATAPSSAVSLELRVVFREVPAGESHFFDAVLVEKASAVLGYFDGDTTDTAGATYAWAGTAHASTSSETRAPGNLGTLAPIAYQNILGPTSHIEVEREGLNVGSLTATLYDAILDPTQTDLIKPGRRLRLITTDGDRVFGGKTLTANVTYHLLEANEQKRAEVTLTAVDPIGKMAAAAGREGVATIAELPYVLEGAGVPWSCNGDGNQVPTATVVSYNDNASALDQVALTRDSVLGYAWVDRNGVLQAWDRTELDATVVASLDETVYTADLDVGFDLDAIINSVKVTILRVIATSGVTEEVTFGPFIDAASFSEWGEHAAEYTVHGVVEDESGAAAYAALILAANAQPVLRANAVTVPIRETADLPLALLDLYDLVNVVNDRANLDEDARVRSVSHSITPSRWLVTFGFAGDGTVAPATAVPAPPTGLGTVKDEIDGAVEDAYALANAAAAAAADAALNATVSLAAANGKSKVTYSLSAPGSTPNAAGDIWFQKESATQTIIGQWEGLGGTSWSQKTLNDAVIANLDAGKLVAGSAFINALWVKTNLTLGDAATNGVIQSHNFASSSVGVYMDKFGLVAKGGTFTGSTFTTPTDGSGGYGELTAGLLQLRDAALANNAAVSSTQILYNGGVGRLWRGFQLLSGGSRIGLGINNAGDLGIWAVGGAITLDSNVRVKGQLNMVNGDSVVMNGGNVTGAGTVAATTVTATNATVSNNLKGGQLFATNKLTTASAVNCRMATSDGELRISTSARRFKDNIRDYAIDTDAVLAVQQRQWESLLEGDDGAHGIGIVAEEVEDLGLGDFVEYDDDGQVMGFAYDRFSIAVLAVAQAQQQQIADLTTRIEQLESP